MGLSLAITQKKSGTEFFDTMAFVCDDVKPGERLGAEGRATDKYQ